MDTPLIVSINLDDWPNDKGGFSTKQLGFIGHVYTSTTEENLKIVYDMIKESNGLFTIYLDVTSITNTDNIISLLDAGVDQVIITSKQLTELKDVKDVIKDRIIISGQSSSEENYPLYLGNISDVNQTDPSTTKGKKSYVPVTSLSEESIIKLIKSNTIPIISTRELTFNKEDGKISIVSLLSSVIKTDRPDKLYATVVTDENNKTLGLVYSNNKSIEESLKTGRGVYFSRERGLWYKGSTSGDIQELITIKFDCDFDCIKFVVKQLGKGFCHLERSTCFGEFKGLSKLEKTLTSRKNDDSNAKSYTKRLFSDEKLLSAKILEEANEFIEAKTREEIITEGGDLIYFMMTKLIQNNISMKDIERNLELKSLKVVRRKGDAKAIYAEKFGLNDGTKKNDDKSGSNNDKVELNNDKINEDDIKMKRYNINNISSTKITELLKRPSQKDTKKIMSIIEPIIKEVKERGDEALIEYTHKFEKATSLKETTMSAPFDEKDMMISEKTKSAIDISFNNIKKFHEAQVEKKPLIVETMPGVVCSRFSRPIEKVGLYVPGGTAVLPSTTLMLGVPAMVAGCKEIIIASPPRSNGKLSPEIVYVASKVGASKIILAGGAQAVASLAYGTKSIPKVDKILGPGNQFVTAAKMFVSNDTTTNVSIDMPAGPSEVLVIADNTCIPSFVAADLLSQAEHGIDSQVILITVDLTEDEITKIEAEIDKQAKLLPRRDIVKEALKHSYILQVDEIHRGIELSNEYAPEHLILQIKNAQEIVEKVENAGSIFIGHYAPESVGDYSSGVNHSLRMSFLSPLF